ncbi:MAG: diacylglycerol kinase family lipid kinase [Oscillospiraceae bacterium]|nr:diacylglycerol kinase family lipid kinase [Oscillospiraceae bacterium]
MKHIFIINPAAGKYDHTGEFTQQIREACNKHCIAYEILVSRGPGDCTRIAQAAAASGDPVRLYACGGDGTLNEVINGVVGYSNAAVTNFPGGSGNDFIRIFSDPSAFRSCERLLDAEVAEFDLIRCGNHYSLNICSMGVDARIASSVSKFKRLPLVSGHGSYLLSTGVHVIKGLYRHYVVEIDGQTIDDELTMICIANARWYGGGFHPIPDAKPDDGMLDVLLVKKISRFQAASFINKYKAGLYKELSDVVTHYRCKKLTIHCDEKSEINLDGELLMAKDATFCVEPKAIRYFYPKGLTY